MYSLFFYPDKPNNTKTVVMAWVSPDKIRFSTRISVNPKYWVGGNKYVSNKHWRFESLRDDFEQLENKILDECKRLDREGTPITKEALELIVDPKRANKIIIKQTIKEVFYADFWQYLDKLNKKNPLYERWKKDYLGKEKAIGKKVVIKNTPAIIGYDAARKGLTMVNWLEKFKKGIKPRDITPATLEKYYEFLQEENPDMSDNTVGKHQVFLRGILDKCKLPYEWVDVNAYAEPENFDMFWHEVVQLQEHNYSRPELQEAAHTFVINCQLALRWSDLSTLQPAHFQEYYTDKYGHIKVISKEQVKTLYGAYIPIPPRAAALIERYNGIPIPGTKKGVPVRDYFNVNLKEAAKEAGLNRIISTKKVVQGKAVYSQAPLHEKIKGHLVRQVAASRMYEATGNDALKEKQLGHKIKHDPYTLTPAVKLINDLLGGWEVIEANLKRS